MSTGDWQVADLLRGPLPASLQPRHGSALARAAADVVHKTRLMIVDHCRDCDFSQCGVSLCEYHGQESSWWRVNGFDNPSKTLEKHLVGTGAGSSVHGLEEVAPRYCN